MATETDLAKKARLATSLPTQCCHLTTNMATETDLAEQACLISELEAQRLAASLSAIVSFPLSGGQARTCGSFKWSPNSRSNRYSAIKAAILARLTDSPDAQLHKLLTGVELGDRCPSQLLRLMHSLAGTRVGDDVLRVKWLDLLPPQMRQMLLLIKNQTLEELSAVTDEAHDMGPSVMATSPYPARSSLPSLGHASPHQPPDQVVAELAALCLALMQLTTLTRDLLHRVAVPTTQRGRSYSRGNRQERGRSATPGPDPQTGHCWYHSKFGALALHCRQPCTFPTQVASAGSSR